MITKAKIFVHLIDGTRIEYVNKYVQDTLGKDGMYYAYSNEPGDKLENQIGAGKALGEFEFLKTQIGGTGKGTRPDDGTDTLKIKNMNNPLSSNAQILTTIPRSSIIRVELSEFEVNEIEQLEYDRNIRYV